MFHDSYFGQAYWAGEYWGNPTLATSATKMAVALQRVTGRLDAAASVPVVRAVGVVDNVQAQRVEEDEAVLTVIGMFR